MDYFKEAAHGEVGIYESWYWGVDKSGEEEHVTPFALFGAQVGSLFGGFEMAPGSAEKAMITGMSWSTGHEESLTLFGVGGVAGPVIDWQLSKAAMSVEVGAADALFSFGMAHRINPAVGLPGLASGVVSGALVGSWVNWQYGK